jgi:hypothetical protein
MVFSFRLLLPAFEDDRVLESIRPADNLFHDSLSCLAGPVLNRPSVARIKHEAWQQRASLISARHGSRVAKPARFTIIRTVGQIIRGLNSRGVRRHILRRCASALSKVEKMQAVVVENYDSVDNVRLKQVRLREVSAVSKGKKET